MNNMKRTRTLALLLLAVAAGNSAQAQAKKVTAGAAYTISSNTAATGTGISYQWYRDGQPISTSATSASYTVPAADAYGFNVEFKRGAKSSSCVGDIVFSNAVVLTFCQLVLSGVCWASANVGPSGELLWGPDLHSEFYQWNHSKAWPTYGTTVTEWYETTITAPVWSVNPCPTGWRLPTQAEFTALHNSGTTWVAAGSSRGNQIAGRFYGSNHATAANCKIPTPMNNCIFLTAGGFRTESGGTLTTQSVSGSYWSSTQASSTYGYSLYFTSSASTPNDSGGNKAAGMNIRCVQ